MIKEKKKFTSSPVELHINRKYYFQLRKVKFFFGIIYILKSDSDLRGTVMYV
jgi:hypothetical protein